MLLFIFLITSHIKGQIQFIIRFKINIFLICVIKYGLFVFFFSSKWKTNIQSKWCLPRIEAVQ